MATIGKKGDSTRHGAVKKRSQVYNATTNRFIKVDEETGRFMDVKADDKPFAGVRKSKAVKKKAKADKKADAKKGTKKKTAKKKAKKKVAKK
jgi:hypothetical protein